MNDPKSSFRRVRIEKLAPTGEGIARTPEGVGFVDRALPGELVETSVYEVRKRFWRGSLRAILEPSPDRMAGPHAVCAGCDWGHFDPATARHAKRELFLETMQRIGKLDRLLFGELPVAASPAGYRLRTRFHVSGTGERTAVGYFAPGSHRVSPAEACEALSPQTRSLLPAAREAIVGSSAEVSELALLEDMEGARRLIRATGSGTAGQLGELGAELATSFAGVRVRSPEGRAQLELGERALRLVVAGRPFVVSVDSFFQANRYLVPDLLRDAEGEARRVPPGLCLDAFGGVGLFAGALLSAGHRVISVESDGGAVADARKTAEEWGDRERWERVQSEVGGFLAEEDRSFACIVVDPPRAGLGTALARELARRTEQLFLYASCDPATLARDLPAILAEGFEVRGAFLYDLFAFTHRVEALIALERVA